MHNHALTLHYIKQLTDLCQQSADTDAKISRESADKICDQFPAVLNHIADTIENHNETNIFNTLRNLVNELQDLVYDEKPVRALFTKYKLICKPQIVAEPPRYRGYTTYNHNYSNHQIISYAQKYVTGGVA